MATETPPTISRFVPPPVSSMTKVLVSRDPDFSSPMPGFVTRVSASNIDAIGFSQSGMFRFISCWHKDDPRCQAHKEQINDDENRGVWDLAQDEKDIRELYRLYNQMAERLNSQEKIITELSARVAKKG